MLFAVQFSAETTVQFNYKLLKYCNETVKIVQFKICENFDLGFAEVWPTDSGPWDC